MKSIQTFLERFNCIPFEEKPQILFQTWKTFFAIQCSQPEDSNELFQKLLKDLKELAEYDQSTRTDRPIFLNDNEDHPVQNKESPENSSKETVQKQKMEDTMFKLVKICQEKEILCIHDDVNDLIESALDSKLLLINSNSQHLDKKEQEIKNVVEQPAEHGNRSIQSLQNFRVVHKSSISFKDTSQISSIHSITPIQSTKEPEHLLSMRYEHLSITPETKSDEVKESNAENLLPIPSKCEDGNSQQEEIDITETDDVLPPSDDNDDDYDPLLGEADLFLSNDSIPPGIEKFADDPEGDIHFLEELLIDDSILSHESFDSSFEDSPLIPRPPSEPPDVETDTGEEISVVMNDKDEDVYSSFILVIYPEMFPLLLSTESEDTIFDPVKVLDNIVYKTGQSVQTMNMLNNKCRTSFAKPEYLKKAKQANPCLYDIGCYNDNLALMLSPESDELVPTKRNAHVEDIVVFETAIARTFLYLGQWLHISSGSGNNLHWQWELILPVGTLTWQWECLETKKLRFVLDCVLLWKHCVLSLKILRFVYLKDLAFCLRSAAFCLQRSCVLSTSKISRFVSEALRFVFKDLAYCLLQRSCVLSQKHCVLSSKILRFVYFKDLTFCLGSTAFCLLGKRL
nr:hypothetical protein [Tanacetum cinerariifolium]